MCLSSRCPVGPKMSRGMSRVPTVKRATAAAAKLTGSYSTAALATGNSLEVTTWY